jgi:hypothetical protein
MPSPIGHALAALTIAWAAEPTVHASARRIAPITLACLAAAVLPDLDLLFYPHHRTVTHSVGATLCIFIITAGVTGWVTGRIAWRTSFIVAAAHASHMLLDWLGVDRFPPAGLKALWPISDQWFVSGWDVFLPTERRDVHTVATALVNLRAALRELAILGTIAAAVWVATRKRRSRVPISAQDVRRRPSGAAGDTGGT